MYALGKKPDPEPSMIRPSGRKSQHSVCRADPARESLIISFAFCIGEMNIVDSVWI